MTVEIVQENITIEFNEDQAYVEFRYDGLNQAALLALTGRVDDLETDLAAAEATAAGATATVAANLNSLDALVDGVIVDLAAETAARIAADSTTNAALLAGDATLQAAIDAEEAARIAADAAEVIARNAAITAALGGVTPDISALEATVAGHTSSITSLVSDMATLANDQDAVEAAFATLSADFAALESDVADNTAAVVAEASARAAADVVLQDQIDLLTAPDAADVAYSNASSGMTATNVQAAIDEIDAVLDDLGTAATADTVDFAAAVHTHELTDLDATGATDGHVATADGAGGIVWEAPTGGGDVSTDAIWDAKGDLAAGTGANTAARLPVGTNGYVLTADSAEATGLKWAAAAASSPTTTEGDLIVRGASADDRLPVGTEGQVLSVVSGVPAWADAVAGGGGGAVNDGCRVRRVATQSLAAATWAEISWDTEDRDDNSYFDSGTPTRITIPESGWYVLSAYCRWSSTTSYSRALQFVHNGLMSAGTGTRLGFQFITSGTGNAVALTDVQYLSAGDYITVGAYSTGSESIGSTDPVPSFSIHRLGVGSSGSGGGGGGTWTDLSLTNGGFETGDGTGWTTTVGTIAIDDGTLYSGFGMVGSYCSFGGESGTAQVRNTFYQDVAATADNYVWFAVTALFMKNYADTDATTLTLEVMDASSNVLATASVSTGFTTTGSATRGCVVPAVPGMTKVRVTVDHVRSAGTNNNTAIDSIVLYGLASGGSGAVATDTIWDAKGDLVGGTGANTSAVLPVGADELVLVSASSETTGLKWGLIGIPQNVQAGDYTLVIADNGKHIFHPNSAGSGHTYTIPANASVAFPVGAAVTFVNRDSNTVAITITSDTLIWSEDGSTGTRTLAQYGMVTALKISSTEWIISGSGLS